jgi:hypothetical protein
MRPSAPLAAAALASVALAAVAGGAAAQAPAPTAPAAPAPAAQPAAQPAAAARPAVVLRAARMFDGTGGAVVRDAAVVVTGDRITAAGPAARVPVPAGARVVDLGDVTCSRASSTRTCTSPGARSPTRAATCRGCATWTPTSPSAASRTRAAR